METKARKKTGDPAIASRIKEARKRAGFGQETLAQKIGVTTSSLGQYETATANPSIEMLIKISNACNVSTDYLLKGANSSEEKVEKLTREIEMLWEKLIEAKGGNLGKNEVVAESAFETFKRSFLEPIGFKIGYAGYGASVMR